MSGRMYTVIMDAQSISTADDLMRISAPADACVVIHHVKITQDAGETSEQLPIQFQRSTTDGTGTAVTARPLSKGDAAFGGTAVVALTVDTTLDVILWREGQNVLNGWEWVATPEERIVISPSGRFVIRLDAAPAAALTFTITAVIEEIGG